MKAFTHKGFFFIILAARKLFGEKLTYRKG